MRYGSVRTDTSHGVCEVATSRSVWIVSAPGAAWEKRRLEPRRRMTDSMLSPSESAEAGSPAAGDAYRARQAAASAPEASDDSVWARTIAGKSTWWRDRGCVGKPSGLTGGGGEGPAVERPRATRAT